MGREGKVLHAADAPVPNTVYIRYNDSVLDPPTAIKQNSTHPEWLDIVAQIPNSVLGTGNGVITVKFPFGGKKWEAKLPIYEPLSPIITRTGGKDRTTLTLEYRRPDGLSFQGNWTIILDKAYKIGNPDDHESNEDVSVKRTAQCSDVEPSCHIVVLSAKTTLLDSYQKMVIISNDGDSLAVSIPPSSPLSQSAQLDKVTTNVMLMNEARAVVFNGHNLSSIKRVFFNNQDLPFTVKGDGNSITVFISTDVTSKAGHKDIAFQVDQNTILAAGIDVLTSGGGGTQSGNTTTGNKNQ